MFCLLFAWKKGKNWTVASSVKDDGSKTTNQRICSSQENDALCSHNDPHEIALVAWDFCSPTSLVSFQDSGACLVSPVASRSTTPQPTLCSTGTCSKTQNYEDTPTHGRFLQLLTVVSKRVCTPNHVSKALRNVWAGIVTDVYTHPDSIQTQ